MDSGIPSLDGFVASGSNQAASQSQVSLIEANNQKDQQVRLARQERPSDAWRTISNYMPKGTIDFSVPKTMLLNQGATLLTTADSMVHGDSHQPGQMLNFPSLRAEVASFLSKDDGLAERTLPNYTSFPHYQSPPSAYARTGGYGGASLNAGMNGPSAFAKGPFTPSQRMELEYQVLIFKYLSANVPVPPELLTPLKKPLYPYPYGFSGGFYGPNSMGWGTLRHMGYMGSPVDPEPGRCRRTDGKKWRCSRDVVGDQKYCERHLNRGRHRSRKLVEGQTVLATAQITNSKAMPATSSTSTLVISNGDASKKFVNVITQRQSRILKTATAVNLESDESPFTVAPKTIEEESPLSEFGNISAESFISSSKRRRYVNSRDSEPFLSFNEQETQDQHPLRQFIEDWPKDQCSRSAISWPEELKSDWTQLSMSTPMYEKIALSPSMLSREFDPNRMGLGMSSDFNELSKKQSNRVPISRGTSTSGPLPEVVNSNSISNAGGSKSSLTP